MSQLMAEDSTQKAVTRTANTLLITAIVEMVLHLAVMLRRPTVLSPCGSHLYAQRETLLYLRVVRKRVQLTLRR